MSDIPRFLPWQVAQASAWLGSRERFGHAWLIHGLSGIGKRQFALAASASLLCEAPRDGLACGQCPACQWVAGGNHPDLRRIRPDAVAQAEGADPDSSDDAADSGKKALSRDIRVDQLRALTDWFNTATHRGGWRVAVLYPAEALNAISANALLKVLEEPPEHTVFLLVVDAPDRILPTLVSRCRRLPLAVPSLAESTAWMRAQGVEDPAPWLAAAGGAPLRALELATAGGSACPVWLEGFLAALASGGAPDTSVVADALEKEPAGIWIDAFQRVMLDLSLAACGAPIRYFPAQATQLGAIASRASAARLSEAGKWLAQQKAVADHPLNAKLFVDSAVLRMVQACLPQDRP